MYYIIIKYLIVVYTLNLFLAKAKNYSVTDGITYKLTIILTAENPHISHS